MRVSIAGGGRGAWTIGWLCRRAGWQIEAVGLRPSSTSPLPVLLETARVPVEELPTSELVVLAVPDDALDELSSSLLPRSNESTIFLHLSGARTSATFQGRGGSLHPLASLPAPGTPPLLEGSLFVGEGSERALEIGAELAGAAGALFRQIDADLKPLYHAAAVLGSNYAALLAELSLRRMQEAGLAPVPRAAIASLAGSALSNWRDSGLDGVTGPISRGDSGTVEAHISALGGNPETREIYLQLGEALARLLADGRPEMSQYQRIADLLKTLRAR